MIKVRARNSIKNKPSVGYMGISLHSKNLDSYSLEAIVNWINIESNFEKIRIGLSDTLHHHNYSEEFGWDNNKSYQECIKEGNRWLLRNDAILKKISIPYEIIRWSYWWNNYSDDINNYILEFNKIFLTNKILYTAIMNDVKTFLKRRNNTINEASSSEINTCIKYLIEELAVYSVIFDNYPCTAIYPGKQLECFRVMRENKITDIKNNIKNSHFVRLNLYASCDLDIAA